ncbi:ImmA/IrrE family metallo-endopeptidase [Nocardia arizonensis]|uniref:ImmA/IrrE family metallo-endopeptidase n=1 Tax=Nocardia arizonensis TaxID=1141647 RepID=UPI000A5E82F1|nr:ImmA/IrrE family metallo-endopeptidase [Nocardia arizonensis]
MQRFVEELSLRRDRPIEIVDGLGEFESIGYSGIWIPLPEKDLIRHRSGFTQIERDGIVAHELGHIILGHEVPLAERIQYFERTAPSIPTVVIKRLMDQQACLRSNFDLPLERQAEWFATLLMEAAASLSRPLFPDRELSPRQRLMLERAAAIFGWSA